MAIPLANMRPIKELKAVFAFAECLPTSVTCNLLVTFLKHSVEFFLHLKPFQHESNVVREDCQEVHHVEGGFQEGDLEWY